MRQNKARRTVAQILLDPGFFLGPQGPSLCMVILMILGLILIVLSFAVAIHPTATLVHILARTTITSIPLLILSLGLLNLQSVSNRAEAAIVTIRRERTQERAAILKKRQETPSNAHILVALKMLKLDESASLRDVKRQSAQMLWIYHPDFAIDPKDADLDRTCRILEARSQLFWHFRTTKEYDFVALQDDSLPWSTEDDLMKDRELWLKKAGERGEFFAWLSPPPVYRSLFLTNPRPIAEPDPDQEYKNPFAPADPENTDGISIETQQTDTSRAPDEQPARPAKKQRLRLRLRRKRNHQKIAFPSIGNFLKRKRLEAHNRSHSG